MTLSVPLYYAGRRVGTAHLTPVPDGYRFRAEVDAEHKALIDSYLRHRGRYYLDADYEAGHITRVLIREYSVSAGHAGRRGT